jgi:hypothetical protein
MGVSDRIPRLHEQRPRDELTRKATLMFPGYYHTPPKPVSTRVRCPVCHQEVYSRAGIHPQCAVKQSESQKPAKPTIVVTNLAVGAGLVADQALVVLSEPPNLVITSIPNTSAPLITAIAVSPAPA